MAVRVQNGAALVFGTMAGSVTATHGRFQKASSDPVVIALNANVTAAAGERLRIPAGDIDVLYVTGSDLNNDHMDAVARAYWDGETIQVDLMTSSTVVVADSGYSQQTHSGWTFASENDP